MDRAFVCNARRSDQVRAIERQLRRTRSFSCGRALLLLRRARQNCMPGCGQHVRAVER
jgi:hypothetical protein